MPDRAAQPLSRQRLERPWERLYLAMDPVRVPRRLASRPPPRRPCLSPTIRILCLLWLAIGLLLVADPAHGQEAAASEDTPSRDA